MTTSALYRYDRVYVGQSQVCDGLGVFASAPFAKGELILAERVVVVFAAEFSSPSLFFDEYSFDWGESDEDAAIPIGISMLFNHGAEGTANLTWRERGDIIEWIALRDIAAGDELLHNYNGAGSVEPRAFPDPKR
jgi:SET domain-containing protein